MGKEPVRDIRNLSLEELEHFFASINEPKYRAGQVFHWLYQKRVNSFNGMTNLPLKIKKALEDNFSICQPNIKQKQVSKIDDTVKYLLELYDGELIETVVIPAENRITVCISSQIGCRYRCKFCASGMYGFKRDLSQAEILSQLITVQEDNFKITNVVFMGIGEPLDNFRNVTGAIKIINDKNGFYIGARKITISTSGITDKIKELANFGIQIELSVSLHAADNKKRDLLMPINKKYPLKELLKGLKEYYEKTKRFITFEYILVKDVNDSAEDADKLIKLLKDLKCKVNLIPLSLVNEIPYKIPEKRNVEIFIDTLLRAGLPATIRFSKGADISAACGQLKTRKSVLPIT